MNTIPEKAREYISEHGIPLHVIRMEEEASLPSERIVVSGVYSEGDEVLFVKSEKPNRYWELPGGRVEDEEKVECALERELYEETGRPVCSATPLLSVLWSFPSATIVNIVFDVDLGEQETGPVDEIGEISFSSSLPEPISFGESGRIAYNHILHELEPGTSGWRENIPTRRPSKRTMAAIGGLATAATVKIVSDRAESLDTSLLTDLFSRDSLDSEEESETN